MAKEKLSSRLDARTVTLIASLIALTCVMTIVIRIPLPSKGYMNLANLAVYFCAFAFGPWIGFIAGGFGTGLADAVLGYPQWMIFSIAAHGCQGFVAGLIARYGGFKTKWMLLGGLVAMVVDCTIYFFATIYLSGMGPAILDIPANLFCNISCLIVAIPLIYAVKKAYPPITQLGKVQQKWEE